MASLQPQVFLVVQRYRLPSSVDNIDGPENRPEGWGLVFKDHPSQGDSDGAFGFIGADYGPSYPSPVKLKATRYREETAKRPVNIKNIKTLSGSQKVGNYSNEIQLFSVSSEHQKTWALEAYNDPKLGHSSALYMQRHYQRLLTIKPLMGISPIPSRKCVWNSL